MAKRKQKQNQVPQVSTEPCICLTKLRRLVATRFGDGAKVEFLLRPTFDLQTGDQGRALPPLDVVITSGRKKRHHYINYLYCPFCGNKNGGPEELMP
jgi:hypothetical protein